MVPVFVTLSGGRKEDVKLSRLALVDTYYIDLLKNVLTIEIDPADTTFSMDLLNLIIDFDYWELSNGTEIYAFEGRIKYTHNYDEAITKIVLEKV